MNNTRVPQPVYRTARLADLDQIIAIEEAVFPEGPQYYMLRQLFDLHGSDWLVAELDDVVIGYALILSKDGRALLSTFAVVEHLQCRGYGRELLACAMERCRETKVGTMWLTVRPANLRAARMFKEAGFVPDRYVDDYFGPGAARDVMECAL
ncbi:GNAT family N-acetyltransferase [Nocardia sp. CA2R105]|uniref:GNAT family N-acetyltransferase n=1 Tax=Nocardia coffeae TaxID=2873381 RepID=UPI001CA60B85|nr:GNAT family N-acetyltransferase [Nocardia coffeae]MBY8861830.1 GNAT family N-acetyltransferase [Nocardia coffeae]